MKARLLSLLVLGLSAVSLGIEYDHTTNGTPTPVKHTGGAVQGSEGCVNCDAPVAVTKSVTVSPPITTLKQTVYKVDCVREEYRNQDYTAWEPKQDSHQESYEYKVNVPTTEYGTVKKTGYKTEQREFSYNYTVNEPQIYVDNCGCKRVRYVCVTKTKTGTQDVSVPYSYDQAVTYPSNKVESRVGQKTVTDIKMVPVTRSRQIGVVVPYATYRQVTEHTATYTIKSEFQTALPTEEGEKLWLQQQQQPQPVPEAPKN